MPQPLDNVINARNHLFVSEVASNIFTNVRLQTPFADLDALATPISAEVPEDLTLAASKRAVALIDEVYDAVSDAEGDGEEAEDVVKGV